MPWSFGYRPRPKGARFAPNAGCRLLAFLLAVSAGVYPNRVHLLFAQTSQNPQDQRIFQMVHTSWTARDGAPQNINTLAQTADGILWLGTRDGLYSFDGLNFRVSNLVPRKNIQSLFASRGGDLWLAGSGVPITRIRTGNAKVFDQVSGDTFQVINQVVESSDGSIWAVLNSKKLVRLNNDGAWHIVRGPKPDCDRLGRIFIDSSDNLWVVADNLLYRRTHGEERFQPTHLPVRGVFEIAEGWDRSIWIAEDGGLKHIDRSGNRLPAPITGADVSDVIAADDRSIWLSHVNSGLQRLRAYEVEGRNRGPERETQDLYGIAEGLSTTGYRILRRDKDGEIWAAGGRGLDKFQQATMVPIIPNAINGWWSFCVAPNQRIWVAVLDGFRAVVNQDRIIRLKDRSEIASILCSQDGRIRMLTGDGIAEILDDRLKMLPLLPNHGPYWEHYRFSSLVALSDGSVIVSTQGATENRVWAYRNGRWRPFLPSENITDINAMMLDNEEKRLYFGSSRGEIFVINLRTLQKESLFSSQIGALNGFSETRDGIFAFGENGIAIDHNGAFRMLTLANPDLATSVTGLTEDLNGDVWINGSRAIARIASAEIALAISQPQHRILAQEFREGGFHGSDIFTYLRNSAQADAHGRIWFATANGIIYIDPNHLVRPSHLPTLSIRSITADGRSLNPNRTIAPGTEMLNVHYFGLNLVNPSAVIYRYRLQGYDHDWQDVGRRAEAIYTHLRPGKYTFQVIASNADGAWTPPLTAPTITVLPDFYETWWFETFCALMAALLLWLGFTMRIRYVAAQVRLRAEERANERIRIARDLHDTLLQGFQGMMLSFHVAVEAVPVDSRARELLESAMLKADRLVREGRDRVGRLRSDSLDGVSLAAALNALGEEFKTNRTCNFEVHITQEPIEIESHVKDELFCIAREAITNSFRHAEATTIGANLDYGQRMLSMCCYDDGCGISPEAIDSAPRRHYGMVGMWERARRIGASFSCESAPGQGTKVSICIRAGRAYHPNGRLSKWLKQFQKIDSSEI